MLFGSHVLLAPTQQLLPRDIVDAPAVGAIISPVEKHGLRYATEEALKQRKGYGICSLQTSSRSRRDANPTRV